MSRPTQPKADGILAESVPETTGVLPVVTGRRRPLGKEPDVTPASGAARPPRASGDEDADQD